MEKHLRSPEAMLQTHTELEAYVEEQGREYQRLLRLQHTPQEVIHVLEYLWKAAFAFFDDGEYL